MDPLINTIRDAGNNGSGGVGVPLIRQPHFEGVASFSATQVNSRTGAPIGRIASVFSRILGFVQPTPDSPPQLSTHDVSLDPGALSHPEAVPLSRSTANVTGKMLNPLIEPLRWEMVKDEEVPKDQRDLLSSVSDAEIVAIRNCYMHPLVNKVVDCVKAGKWEDLIKIGLELKSNGKPTIYSILKAAFCQGLLGERHPRTAGMDNLASAYIFLGPAMAKQKYTIYSYDEVKNNTEKWGDISKRWDDKSISQVPLNQRYFILVKKDNMTKRSAELMRALHHDDVAGGLKYNEDQGWAQGSAGLCRSDSCLKGVSLVYGRNLRPIGARFDNLIDRSLDIALHEPTDNKPEHVHGVSLEGNLLTIHDFYHAAEAVKNKIFDRPGLFELGKKCYGLLLRKSQQIPPYSKNVAIAIEPGKFHAYLAKSSKKADVSTRDDQVRFYLSEALILIQDGGASIFQTKGSPESILLEAIQVVYHRQASVPPQGYKQPPAETVALTSLTETLNMYLNCLGINIVKPGNYFFAEKTTPGSFA